MMTEISGNGGLQFITQIIQQTIYLDFDGESTCYDGEILALENVDVQNSNLTEERIVHIVSELNSRYAAQNVVFVTERPVSGEYSTVYVGKTQAFDPYGNFIGLAETVDENNAIKTDNAFVLLDAASSDEKIISAVSHETDHLLGTLIHEGVGLQKYAWEVNVNFNETSSGLQVGPSNSVHVNKGGKAVDTLLWGGTAYNDSGFSVSSGWGKMIVSADGVATGTVISNSGAVSVWGGGSALDTQIYSGGEMLVGRGAYVSGVVVHSGGTLETDYYNTGNAKIYGIVESGGAVFGDESAQMEFLPVKLENFVISGIQTTIHSATSAYNTTVDRGTLTVFNSGIASGVTVNFTGSAVISSGGTAALVKENGGAVWVSSGANVSFVSNTLSGMVFSGFRRAVTLHSATIASHATLDSEAEMYIFEGGKAFDMTLRNYCELYIYSGGTADNVKISEPGVIRIASGGVLNSLTLNEGTAWLVGGTVNNVIVNGGGLYGEGSMSQNPPDGAGYISGAGIANNVTVNSGGYAEITSGSAVTVNQGGYLEAGNYLSGIVENGGYVSTTSNTKAQFASNTFSGLTFSGTVDGNGNFKNATSATAHAGTVALSNTLTLAGKLNIFSGGIASATQVDAYGQLFVYSSGLAIDTKLNSKGSLYLGSNGSAKNTIVDDSGVLMISSGGIHAGTLKIVNNGSVTVKEGGIINFDISERSTGDDVLINDLTLIQGTPTYTITVENNQKNGQYQLAAGAANFTGTITITNTTGAIGIVSIGAPGLGDVANNKLYTLTQEEGTLTLTVAYSSSFIPPEPIEGVPVLLCSGNTLVSSGVMLDNIQVSSSYTMLVSSGGAAVSTTIFEGGNVLVYSSGAAVDTLISGGMMTVSSGGLSNTRLHGDLTLDGAAAQLLTIGSNGTAELKNQTIANSVTVSSGGQLNVSGGQITDLTLAAGGRASVKGNALLSDITLSGTDTILTLNGGSALNVTLGTGAVFTASENAIISNVTVSSNGTFQLNEGAVYNGNITIDAAGLVTVSGGQFKFDLANYDGEVLFINDLSRITGDALYSLTIQAQQNIGTYQLAGEASAFTGQISLCINGICRDLSLGNYLVDETNNRRYTLAVQENILTLNVRKEHIESGLVNIYSSGTLTAGEQAVSGVILSGKDNNSMAVLSGGRAELTTVSSGGIMETAGGGLVSGASILSGGSAVFASGAILQGEMLFAGNVSLSSGTDLTQAQISLNITSRTAQDGVILNDLSALGKTAFSITVSANQKSGVYSLASGAADFTGSITICTNLGTCYEPLTVGSCLTVQETNYTYCLSVTDGLLSLEVESKVILPGKVNLYNGGKLVSGADSFAELSLLQGSIDSMVISSGGSASETIVSSGGKMRVYNGIVQDTTATYDGTIFLYAGGQAQNTVLQNGGKMHVKNEAVVSGLSVQTGAALYISSGAVFQGDLTLGGMTRIYGTATAENVTLDLTGRTSADGALIFNLEHLDFSSFHVTVSPEQSDGVYTLAFTEAAFNASITFCTPSACFGTLSTNSSIAGNDRIYTLIQNGNLLQLSIRSGENPLLTGLAGDQNGLSWNNDPQSDGYAVSLSSNGFAAAFDAALTTNALDIFGMASGSWQWKVKRSGDNTWTQGENFEATSREETAQNFQSDADGDLDLFFARSSGKWSKDYAAEHQGCLNGWTGTGEQVSLEDKNILADCFSGSTDANILALTDDACGDALFIDDIYSASGEEARVVRIREIRAGDGDDIVDLTSQRYAADVSGVTVYGGLGNDTLWAGNGSSTLFGDAGNDRLIGASGNDILVGGLGNDTMNGGGGKDTFFFSSNWGCDTVEQLDNGQVTLHFECGSMENWNADTLTYTDGQNTVTVTGTTEVVLLFGTTGVTVPGAFADAASEKIFETNSSFLA